jgi:hypothetical protein
MSRFRRIFFAFWLALAVVAGQYAVAAHDLAHAAGHKEGVPGKSTCDTCFACAELSSAVGASIPPVVLPDNAPQAVLIDPDTAVCAAPRLAFQSRGPPTLA